MRFEPLSKATEAVVAGLGAITHHDRRRSAEELLAEELSRCSDCGRTPLIGEHVHLYGPTDVVCELCRTLRAQAPVSSSLVRHSLGPAGLNDPDVVVKISRR